MKTKSKVVPSRTPVLRCVIVLLLAHAGNWQLTRFVCQLSGIHLKKHGTCPKPLLLHWFLYHLSPLPCPRGNNVTLVSKSVGMATVSALGEGCQSVVCRTPQKPGQRCTGKQGGEICCLWLTLATGGYTVNVFFQVQFHSPFSNSGLYLMTFSI